MKRILLILAGIITIINCVFIYCSCIIAKRCDEENEKRNKRKKR